MVFEVIILSLKHPVKYDAVTFLVDPNMRTFTYHCTYNTESEFIDFSSVIARLILCAQNIKRFAFTYYF